MSRRLKPNISAAVSLMKNEKSEGVLKSPFLRMRRYHGGSAMSIFVFTQHSRSSPIKKSIAPPPGKYNIASALSFHVIQYNNGCSWRASFPSRKSGVFCCHFFGDDPVACRCRSPPPFDSPVNHP